jgi:hypothetical protein
VQVERHLRGIERDALHHPVLGERDLGPVLRFAAERRARDVSGRDGGRAAPSRR